VTIEAFHSFNGRALIPVDVFDFADGSIGSMVAPHAQKDSPCKIMKLIAALRGAVAPWWPHSPAESVTPTDGAVID
jgi:hypothetical protein